ncbi:MAG: hypothetical protein LT106_13185 [Burkholderiaceae bacterium]|nr:hypothetical protein [Burkholderiaceae bacterium]
MKFAVGDVCITQNSRVPAINDNALVIVTEVNASLLDYKGRPIPYLIRSVDGRVHGATNGPKGELRFAREHTAWAREDQLRKVDMDDEGWTDAEEIEQRSMQRVLERAVFSRA